MSFSAYLWGIRFLTLLSLSAWLGIVFAVDPERSGVAGMGLFFVSLFAMMLGFLTLMITWTYRKALGEASAAHYFGGAFRQAFLVTMYLVGIVLFQYLRILTWWDAALFFAAVLLIEFSLRRLSRA